MAAAEMDEATLTARLATLRPQVIGITAVCANYLDAIDAAAVARRTLGSFTTIVLGGPHPSYGAATILSHHSEIDFCVIGEGELTFVDLLRQLDSQHPRLAQVPGLALRASGRVVRTAPRPAISDLDSLPYPARHLLEAGRYPATIRPLTDGTTSNTELIASRGCPYPCEFCSTKEFWGRKYRRHSATRVAAELAHLQGSGFTNLYFDDDIFTIDRRWVLELCRLLVDQGRSIRWACGTRVDRVDQELLSRMKEAGCRYIYFGVESGDETIIEMQDKRASLRQVESAYDFMKDAGIYSSAALIFGLPGETWETAKRTVDWVRDRLRPDELWISKACCYPGTPLARKYGITAEDYEVRVNGRCQRGWRYGSGGIYTPFFDDDALVIRTWDYIHRELGHLDLLFGDESEPYVPTAAGIAAAS
jgi:radical SAM superfamily enzyme YgiQ (UPF0313 family)